METILSILSYILIAFLCISVYAIIGICVSGYIALSEKVFLHCREGRPLNLPRGIYRKVIWIIHITLEEVQRAKKDRDERNMCLWDVLQTTIVVWPFTIIILLFYTPYKVLTSCLLPLSRRWIERKAESISTDTNPDSPNPKED